MYRKKQKTPDLFTNLLIAATLKRAARKKYSEEITRFLGWQKPLPRFKSSLDEMLAAYILEGYHANPKPGERKRMKFIVPGIFVLHPNLKRNLLLSHVSVGWNRLVLPKSALSLTKCLLNVG